MNKNEIEPLLSKGLSSYKIADALGVSASKVRYWTKKLDLEVKVKEKLTYVCLYCNKVNEEKWVGSKYCNNNCSSNHFRQIRIDRWLENPEQFNFRCGVSGYVREYLKRTRGSGCEICGIVKWNEKEIVLECDHIDGNHENNYPNNLRMICPNCHSQTSTYKAKNRGNGRKHRKPI